MTLPGFNAETALYKTSVDYRSHAVSLPLVGAMPQLVAPPATVCGPCNRAGWRVCHRCTIEPAHCLYWIQECWPPPEPPPPPPDCTTTGCPPGQICCDCVDPPRRPSCTSARRCKTLCSL